MCIRLSALLGWSHLSSHFASQSYLHFASCRSEWTSDAVGDATLFWASVRPERAVGLACMHPLRAQCVRGAGFRLGRARAR